MFVWYGVSMLCMKAANDAKAQKPHNNCTSSLVVYHSQNMEIPVFNQKQLGITYHYSLLNIYNLGVVDHTYI